MIIRDNSGNLHNIDLRNFSNDKDLYEFIIAIKFNIRFANRLEYERILEYINE